MPTRSIYLAKSRSAPSQRAHFALFIPNTTDDRANLSNTFRSDSTKGTIIHVIGEPVMIGYVLELKRNYECSTSSGLQELVRIGSVQTNNIFDPADTTFKTESTARALLEMRAAQVKPPPAGQNIRAPVDGINTKRCQEWTMEYLERLVREGLIDEESVEIVQRHRDSSTHGIFGQRAAR